MATCRTCRGAGRMGRLKWGGWPWIIIAPDVSVPACAEIEPCIPCGGSGTDSAGDVPILDWGATTDDGA